MSRKIKREKEKREKRKTLLYRFVDFHISTTPPPGEGQKEIYGKYRNTPVGGRKWNKADWSKADWSKADWNKADWSKADWSKSAEKRIFSEFRKIFCQVLTSKGQ